VPMVLSVGIQAGTGAEFGIPPQLAKRINIQKVNRAR